MPSRESEFAARMTADSALMATLTGGVYQSGLVGVEGITRETTPAAFTNGYLQPCALIRQRGRIPDGQILDTLEQDTSAAQVVEIWLYEDKTFSAIDAALERLFVLWQGATVTGSFPIELVNEINRQRDEGALKGKSLARVDFLVRSILGG
jgi:hypothetical protein